MWKRSGPRFMLGLMPVATLCLSSCAAESFSPVCPLYPVAGETVAAELAKLPFDAAPHFWEWLGRVDKLRQELEICRQQ